MDPVNRKYRCLSPVAITHYFETLHLRPSRAREARRPHPRRLLLSGIKRGESGLDFLLLVVNGRSCEPQVGAGGPHPNVESFAVAAAEMP